MPPTDKCFYVAPFVLNGEFLGIGEWKVSDLSVRWLDFASEVLRAGGPSCKKLLPAPFERVSLELTSAQGATVVTFGLDGMPAASSMYLRGENLVAEHELLQIFVKSMRRVELVRQTQLTAEPFKEILGISERPLHIVVSWPSAEENDAPMICELNNHFAAAFFQSDFGR